MKPKKVWTNPEIAELLRAVGAAYQLKDPARNKFKIIAYQRAADAVEHATSELKDLWDDGKLKDVPGIGPSIAQHLDELFRAGESKHFDEVMKGLPPGMFDLMKVSGIGAKRAFRFAKELGVSSLKDLEKAAKTGKIAKLEGFGEQSEKDIAKSLAETKERVVRNLLPHAAIIANDVMEWMIKDKNVKKIDPLGSLRRQAATIGDIDLSVATTEPQEVLEHFTKYPKASRVIEKGTISSSIIVPGGIQVDLMVQPPEAYGSLLQHFTGSKHHNVALREFALKKGLSLSEKGIKDLKTGKVMKFSDEHEFYKYLGLSYIPPEMREDTGEIDAAKENKIPRLVEIKDIKADLQIHSSYDVETSHDVGDMTMEEIMRAADEHGYEYVAFTEHNPSQAKHSDKQVVEILKRKREKVDKINFAIQNGKINYSIGNMKFKRLQKVFNSLEIDILPNGKLPVPEAGLLTLDFALVSIHSSFRLDRSIQTKRVLTALENPKVQIFAHPTGRKLNEREGADLNWPEIFEFALKRGKWIEINADPNRLDLPDSLVREGVKRGIKFSLGTDTHHKDGLNNMGFGVSVARRGWCEARDIVNTRSLKEFEKLLVV